METVDIRLSNLMAFHATARGSWGCQPKYYKPVLDLVLAGKVEIGPFVKTFPMAEINAVFELVHGRKIPATPHTGSLTVDRITLTSTPITRNLPCIDY